MEAFTALPIPQMIDDFRSVRRQSGNDGCCRPVLCHYLRYLHPTLYDLVDHSFCDGGNSACKPEKCTESKVITESRGVTARAPGEQYVSDTDPKDVLTMVDVKTIAPDEGAYGSVEELENAIEQVLPSGAKVVQDNKPNASTRAAVVAELTDASGTPQFWVRYLRQIPPQGIHGTWKTLRGYKFTKGAAGESVPIKPTDLVNDESYKSPKQLQNEITRNMNAKLQGDNAGLIPVMTDAMNQARAGTTNPIKGAMPYYNVLVKYGGEYLGPMALIDGGNQKGNTPEMLAAYELDSLKGSKVMFPQDAAFALVDSFIKTPSGQEIGVSSKAHTGGGAASSLSGVSQQLTDEIRSEFPKGAEIIDTLGTESAINGPLKVAKMFGLINDKDIQEIATLPKGSQDASDIKSPRLKKLMAVTKSDPSNPAYRVLFHLMAGIVTALIPKVNADPEFKGAMMAALNNNKFVQLMTSGKKAGDAVVLDYYTKFPAVFEGAPSLFNKSYFATGQKGRLGFKLKK